MRLPSVPAPSDRRISGDGNNRGISSSDSNIGGKSRRRDDHLSTAVAAASGTTASKAVPVGASRSWNGNIKKTNASGSGVNSRKNSLPRPSDFTTQAVPSGHSTKRQSSKEPVSRPTNEKQQQKQPAASRRSSVPPKQPTKTPSTAQPPRPRQPPPKPQPQAPPSQPNIIGNNANDVEVGLGGWLDGLGNFMGLRPPAFIDVSQPSLLSGSPGVGAGGGAAVPHPPLPIPPPPPLPPAAAAAPPVVAAKTVAVKRGASGGAGGSPRIATPQPPPPARRSSRSKSRSSSRSPACGGNLEQKDSKKTEKLTSAGGIGNGRSEEKKKDRESPSSTRLSGKPPKEPLKASGPTKNSPPSSSSSKVTAPPRPTKATPSRSTTAPSTGSKTPDNTTKTSKLRSSSPRPIKLISSSRPTIAAIPSTVAARKRAVAALGGNTPPRASTIKAGKPGKKRRRRQISGGVNEVLAVLERGVKLADDDDEEEEDDDDDDDVISVKETFLEGVKSWKPTFLRSPPPAMAARAASRLGARKPTNKRNHEQRRRRRDRDEGRNRSRSTTRRGKSQSGRDGRTSSKMRSDGGNSRKDMSRSERNPSTSAQRKHSTGSSNSGSNLNLLAASTTLAYTSGGERRSSRKEALEHTMNVTLAGSSSKQRQSSLVPGSSSNRSSSKSDPRTRSSSSSKRNKQTSATNCGDVDLEAGLGKPPMTPSRSNRRSDTKKSAVTSRSRSSSRPRSTPSPTPPAPSNTKSLRGISSHDTAPSHKSIKKASPARSTKSSRTALTATTGESYDGSPQVRRSRSSSKRRGVILQERDAVQASSGPDGRLESTRMSPADIVDKTPSPPPPTDEEIQKQKEQARQDFYANNFTLFAHGRLTTIIPVICAGAALILSVAAKRTTSFVTLKEPMLVSPTFEKVHRVGLVYLDLCLADEITTVAEGSGITTVVERDYQRGAVGRAAPGSEGESNGIIGNLLSWASPPSIETFDQVVEDYDHDDYIFVGPSDDEFETDLAGWGEDVKIGADTPPKICRSVKITSSLLNDNLWHVARTFLSLAIGFGFFLSFMLCSAAYWSTINLKPVAIGLLMTYFFQSMTFFFFDSGTCHRYDCTVSSGAASAIVASIFWFAAAVGTIWMDFVLQSKTRRKRRRERRRRRRERRARRKREAKAAFEAAKKKAEAVANSTDAAPLLSVEVEWLDDTNRSYDFESEMSHVSCLDDGEDNWLENDDVDVVYDDYEWEEEGGLEVEAIGSAATGEGPDILSSWWW